MNDLITAPAYCPSCGVPGGDTDRFCRQCGAPVSGETATLIAQPRPRQIISSPAARSLLQRRWVVVALLATIGPLGLPALWLSPRFSRRTKILTTIAYFLLTVVAPLALTWYCLDTALRPLVDAFPPAVH